MESFWITLIFASLLIAAASLWLLKWLKSNYPQAYENDPVMAGMGGVAAVSVIASSKLPIDEPFHIVFGMIPVSGASYLSDSADSLHSISRWLWKLVRL